MDLPTILVKITGVLFLALTIRSVVKHIHQKQQEQAANHQAWGELILNNIILYLWLTFMIVFSIGMIVNN